MTNAAAYVVEIAYWNGETEHRDYATLASARAAFNAEINSADERTTSVGIIDEANDYRYIALWDSLDGDI